MANMCSACPGHIHTRPIARNRRSGPSAINFYRLPFYTGRRCNAPHRGSRFLLRDLRIGTAVSFCLPPALGGSPPFELSSGVSSAFEQKPSFSIFSSSILCIGFRESYLSSSDLSNYHHRRFPYFFALKNLPSTSELYSRAYQFCH
jgi:hypothetical protein